MQYDSNALLPGVGAQSENRSPAAEPYQKKNKNPALRAEKPYLAMRSFFSEAQRRGVFAFTDFKAWNAACGAVLTDGSLLMIRQHQRNTQILKRLKSMKGFF